MPFTDPMADGPAIQASSLRALKAGETLKKTLSLVKEFRAGEQATPIVLMGYYNPIYSYGVDAFLKDALAAGVDGLIIVDLPPEEDSELCVPRSRPVSTSSASRRRPPTITACRPCSGTRRASSTTSRSSVSPHQVREQHRHRQGRAALETPHPSPRSGRLRHPHRGPGPRRRAGGRCGRGRLGDRLAHRRLAGRFGQADREDQGGRAGAGARPSRGAYDRRRSSGVPWHELADQFRPPEDPCAGEKTRHAR